MMHNMKSINTRSRLPRPLLALSVMAVATLAGCSGEPHFPAGNDAFYQQPEWAGYRQKAKDNGYEPGVMDWRQVPELAPESPTSPCNNPQETLESWAEARNLVGTAPGEALQTSMRTRKEAEGQVTGLLQRWGFRDDAVAGVDHRIRIERINGCWQIQRVEARHYCRRGMEDGRCL